jgi:hydroxyacylglutathione hydrolase
VIFRQLLDPDLGCACYLLADGERGVVVDPGLDVDRVLAAAREERVRIELVLETHVHADHVSGRELLARRTGAAVRVPAGGGYEDGVGAPLRDGDTIELGALRLTVRAAPGHRPEHIVLLAADLTRSPRPWLLLSGDSLLIGDLARPDLAVDPREGTRALHATLASLGDLPDHVELWPGHVGGSLCGGPGLSRKTSSTLGYERATDDLLHAGVEELTDRLIGSLPERPPTVEAVVARNRGRVPAPSAEVPALDPAALAAALADGVTLLDARPADAFDARHVRGSLSLALAGSGLGTRAAWLLDPEQDLAVLADDTAQAAELTRRLRAVGLAHVRGAVVLNDLDALGAAGVALDAAPAYALADLPALAGTVTFVDVRDVPEWRAGHLAEAVHLPLARLRAEADRLPDGPLAVLCKSGPRAAFAASWLRARGHDARRVADGGIPDLPPLGLALTAA